MIRSLWATDQQWATEGYVVVREEMLTFEIKYTVKRLRREFPRNSREVELAGAQSFHL